MNKLTKWTGVVAAVLLAATSFSLAGCGGGNNDKNSVKKYTVDFETNGGSEIASQQVEEGGKATKPEDPTKTDYVFQRLVQRRGSGNRLRFRNGNRDFGYHDLRELGVLRGHVDCEFLLELRGRSRGSVFVQGNSGTIPACRIPGAPARDGFYFGGWYSEDGSAAYSSMKKYTGDQNFYAKMAADFYL